MTKRTSPTTLSMFSRVYTLERNGKDPLWIICPLIALVLIMLLGWKEIMKKRKCVLKPAAFDLGGDKAPGPDGFPIASFPRFGDITKEDIMNFFKECHH